MRPVAQRSRILRLAVIFAIGWAVHSSTRALAQAKASSNETANKQPPILENPDAIARGLTVYKDRCAICHYSDIEVKKIGPGLGHIYKRGKFSGGGNVDDASIEKWILNGDKDMPSFKAALNPNQIRDLMAYLRTLR